MPLRNAGNLAILERALNAAGLAVWACDANNRCTHMSEYWREMTGQSLSEVLDLGWQKHVHPPDLAPMWRRYEEALARRDPFAVEYRVRRTDDTLFWIRVHGVPVFDQDEFGGYVGTILDIDERKRLEEEIREINERFALAHRATRDGLWEWNLLTDESYMSERGHEMLGYPTGHITGHRQYLKMIHPHDRKRVVQAMQRHLVERVPYDVEYRVKSAAGPYRWLHSRGQAVWDADGQPLRVAGSAGDITDRKKAERRVRQLNARLLESNAAHQRQGELLQTLAQRLIEVGEQERSRVARDLHDDLIQNLAYLQMRVAHLAQSTPRLQAPLMEIEKLAERIVDDVRRVARDLHSTVLDHLGLEKALRSYCAEFAANAKIAIDVRRKGRAQEPPAPIGLCLYRVAQEAIRNAARHSGAAGVVVKIESAPQSLRMRVEDKGSGFTPEVVEKGLGLTSMAERVRLAGGNFVVQTRPGKGTSVEATFTWTA